MEVHAVISQYIIECMDSNEVFTLAQGGPETFPVQVELNITYEQCKLLFQNTHGVHDPSSLTVVDFLKYTLNDIDNRLLPFHLHMINRCTVTDPHAVIQILQEIKNVLMRSPYTIYLLSLLGEEINSLISDCKQILKDIHKLCRKLNQRVQRNLFEQNYDKLIQTVEEFIKNYPLCSVAQKAVIMVKRIIPYCDGELLHYVMLKCEYLQVMTCDHHTIITSELPYIKLCIKLHKQITGSLLNGLPDTEMTYHYFISGKYHEEVESVNTNRLIKLQEVAPNFANFVIQLASQQ